MLTNLFYLKSEIAFILLFLLSVFVFFLLKKNVDSTRKIRELRKLLKEGQKEAEQAKSIIVSEEELKLAKQKLEDKNKKLWAMSEAVHKEKRKVDEQYEKLLIEKEKLEVDKKKLDDKVKKLWQTSTAVHKEKERINELKTIVEENHQSIVDSVTYAKRIQDAILPTQDEIEKYLPDSFVLFKPRDIVSGDFYWFARIQNGCVIACCDCTGHGVPGAFMSMIGNTLLSQIVLQKGIFDPGEILTELDFEVNKSLKQNEEVIPEMTYKLRPNDGMDVALCYVTDKDTEDRRRLLFSGANRPLYIVSEGELIEYKSAKFGIGGMDYTEEGKVFSTISIQIKPGDSVYLSSDGYADQFNEEDNKLMTKTFKNQLLNNFNKNFPQQKLILDEFLENWKGSSKQTDDICVIGFKI